MDKRRPAKSFNVGARLKAIRELMGWSQRELAQRAGVTNGTVSLIEQNRISPSVGSLKKLLDGVPMSFADFFAQDFLHQPKMFFAAEDMVEIAGGLLSYRQVGRDMTGRKL